MKLRRPSRPFRWGPLFRLRRSYWPTWRGSLLLLVVIVAGCGGLRRPLYRFFAQEAPAPQASWLVVEGWMPDYAMQEILTRYRAGKYQGILTTGGPLERGQYLSRYDSSAELCATTFHTLGIPETEVQAIPGPRVPRDRTYHAARALKKWIREQPDPPKAIDLFSLGPHARRSRLLYELALGKDVQLGILAGRPDYDPEHWWRYSEGVRVIISEGLAYLYASCFFDPEDG